MRKIVCSGHFLNLITMHSEIMMRRACFLSLMLAGLWGCGGGASDAPEIAPTGGVVNFNGGPLANATLTFYPEKGPAGIAVVNENGEFRVKTNGSDGAIPGSNKITVATGESADSIPPADGKEMQRLKKPTIPVKYLSKDTTDLIVDVPKEGNLELKLDLTK